MNRRKFVRLYEEEVEINIEKFRLFAEKSENLLGLIWSLHNIIVLNSDRFSMSTPIAVSGVHSYLRHAALMSFQREPNIGLALTRMACELARDVIIFSNDRKLEHLWFSRSSGSRKGYQQKFRFCEIGSVGKALYTYYKKTSEFGVHGHYFFSSSIGAIENVSGENFIRMGVSNDFIKSALTTTIHVGHLFLIGFLTENGEIFKEIRNSGPLEAVDSLIYLVRRFEFSPEM